VPHLCRNCFAILSYIFYTQNTQVRLFLAFCQMYPYLLCVFRLGGASSVAMAEAISQRTDYHDIKSWVFRAFVWCLVLVKTASLMLWRICRCIISSISFISPAPNPEYFCFFDMKDCFFLHYIVFQVPLLILDSQYRIIFFFFFYSVHHITILK
jgi:hypothetical protein